MRISIILFTCFIAVASCDQVTDKTKQAINKTGEALGEGGSEFAKGISKGVNSALSSDIVISDALKQKGVSFGKFDITTDTGSSKNKLVIYLIFNKGFSSNISAKVYDQKGVEYGRATIPISGKQNEAKYVNFIFDPRTDIESKSRIVIE